MKITFGDVAQILAALISAAGAIIAARIGSRKREEIKNAAPGINQWALVMWICVVIAAVDSGILAWRWLRPSPNPEITITYPVNQAKTEQTETVRGTSQALPSGQAIWVVVFAQEVGRYYPQNQRAEIEAGNNWSSITYLGIPADTGKKFDIIAVAADSDAQRAFDTYLAEARDKKDWPGLAALPGSAIIYDRITILRK